MTSPANPGAAKGIQSNAQLQNQPSLSQQNGTMPPPTPTGHKYLPHQISSAHAMSGYAMALTPRHDRVDYSMAKGGFRLWIVLFVFFMLVSGMITIFSNKKEFVEVDLDVDGDGELDDVEHDDDLDDAVHSETKYEQEKIDKSSPTRTADGILSPPESGRRRGKSKEKNADDDEHDQDHDQDHDHDHGDDHDHEKDHGHDHDHEHGHKHHDIDWVKEAEDPRHTVGPDPPILKLKEPLKKALKKSMGKPEPETHAEEKEEEPKAHDEETLLQRLWEKMKKTVKEQQKKHVDVDEEDKPELKTPKKRKRGEKHIEETKTEDSEPVEEEKTAEKPRKRAKSKPAVEEVVETEDTKAEPEEEKVDEPEKPHRRRRGKPEPRTEVEETPEPESEQAEDTQEPETAKPGRRRRTKTEKVEESQAEHEHMEETGAEKEQEHEEDIIKEKPSRRRKTKTPVETVEEEQESEIEQKKATVEKPKIRVFRAKGRPREEAKPTPAPTPEPKSEPEPDQSIEEPSKPKIPVRVIRRKGRTKEEIEHVRHEDHHEAESESESEPEAESPSEPSGFIEEIKQQIKVRFFRSRGKKADEISHSPAESEAVNHEKEGELEGEKEEKKKIPVRVFRIKGKKGDFESDDSGGDSGEARDKSTALRVPEYRKHLITNREDNKIRELLDEADRLVDDRKTDDALSTFDKLLKAYPRSPRVHYGKARALEQLASEKQSNAYLDACIREYEATLRLPGLTDGLLRLVTDRLVDRARFRGWLDKAALAQSRLVDKHPNDLHLLNDFGITYLMMGRYEDAKKIFDNVLSKDPQNGIALVHYGFILKTVDENYTFAVDYMSRGIESEDEGTQDGRFYFHLGDALQKLNRTKEAYDVYEHAAKMGIFLSKYQRSLYNVAGLSARPFWTPEETSHAKYLRAIESEWKAIRDESLALLNQKTNLFIDDDEAVTVYGNLKEFVLYAKGRRIDANCVKTPKTCAIVARFPDAVTCTRGEIKFSLMEGGTRVWPHCGPTNCRLRGHLGLVVPPDARLRVGDEIKSWRQGKFLILDDSFENEVWHDGSGFRLILVLDFWHPELTPQQRASLTPI